MFHVKNWIHSFQYILPIAHTKKNRVKKGQFAQ